MAIVGSGDAVPALGSPSEGPCVLTFCGGSGIAGGAGSWNDARLTKSGWRWGFTRRSLDADPSPSASVADDGSTATRVDATHANDSPPRRERRIRVLDIMPFRFQGYAIVSSGVSNVHLARSDGSSDSSAYSEQSLYLHSRISMQPCARRRKSLRRLPLFPRLPERLGGGLVRIAMRAKKKRGEHRALSNMHTRTNHFAVGCDFFQCWNAARISLRCIQCPWVFDVLETMVSGAISPFSILFRNSNSAIGPTVFAPPKNPFFMKYQSADIWPFLPIEQQSTQ